MEKQTGAKDSGRRTHNKHASHKGDLNRRERSVGHDLAGSRIETRNNPRGLVINRKGLAIPGPITVCLARPGGVVVFGADVPNKL